MIGKKERKNRGRKRRTMPHSTDLIAE